MIQKVGLVLSLKSIFLFHEYQVENSQWFLFQLQILISLILTKVGSASQW